MKGINNGPHQDKRNKVMDLIRIKGIRSRTSVKEWDKVTDFIRI